MLAGLGIKRDEAVVHPWVDKAIRVAQGKLLFRDAVTRWHAHYASTIDSDVRKRMMGWYF